jgi:hypothetical protein
MLKRNRGLEVIRGVDNDLLARYEELLLLRAELARLLFPLKKSPPRRRRMARSNRSTARALQLNERPASCLPILLLTPRRP